MSQGPSSSESRYQPPPTLPNSGGEKRLRSHSQGPSQPPVNPANGTSPVTEFILLGFPSLSRLGRILACALLSCTYAGTLASNLSIVWAVLRDPRLQRLPMYILLGNFAWLQVCYVTTTVPRMLFDLMNPGVPISFHACFVQFYIFFSTGTTECFFLAAMALDRYLAICHPLRYPVLMSPHSSWVLAAFCWLAGYLWFIGPVALISQLSFCGTLDHFVCGSGTLLAVSCTPAPRTEQTFSTTSYLLLFTTITFTLTSYGLVIRAVLRLPTGAGWHKAFSTCTSHLAVVGLYYSSVWGASGSSGKVVALFYTVGTPFLNPLIYSLRNKEMKEALRRTLLGGR